MKFTRVHIEGVFIIDIERQSDSRGSFARTYCAREFEQHQLSFGFVQCNISSNLIKGTVRGLHYQVPPDGETKLVRCTQGAIYDVVVDLRPNSPTYRKYFAVELSAASGRSLYIPIGCAHGFQTLEDDAEVFYQMTNFYAPAAAGGLRYNDPLLRITWPLPVSRISEKDLELPCMDEHWKNPFETVLTRAVSGCEGYRLKEDGKPRE